MTNIRSGEHYAESWWDWTPYNTCFEGTHIRITDVDGLVERNGQFLLIETKRPGIPVPMGQRILFDRITKQPNWHVLIIWGETDCPQKYMLWGYKPIVETDQNGVKSLIARWFKYANGKKPA